MQDKAGRLVLRTSHGVHKRKKLQVLYVVGCSFVVIRCSVMYSDQPNITRLYIHLYVDFPMLGKEGKAKKEIQKEKKKRTIKCSFTHMDV